MLTQLEQKVLDRIIRHIQQNGSSPTIAEIATSLNISSRGTVHRYVRSLIEKGKLSKEGRGWRGLTVLEDAMSAGNSSAFKRMESTSNVEAPDAVYAGLGALTETSFDAVADTSKHLPLLGRVAAGLPIEALPDESQLDLAAFFIGPDRYALRVTGDSMKDAGIMDGDTVIMHNRSKARSGDIVVALIDEREATLKRLGEFNATVVELIPENSEMSPMRYAAARVSIQGVLVGQLRSY